MRWVVEADLLEPCVGHGHVCLLRAGIIPPPPLEQGSNLWSQAIGRKYTDWLSEEDLKRLNILYQKRHLLAHNEGIVDEKYVEKSGDQTYQVGQRIVISKRDIDDLIASLEKLGTELKNAQPEH